MDNGAMQKASDVCVSTNWREASNNGEIMRLLCFELFLQMERGQHCPHLDESTKAFLKDTVSETKVQLKFDIDDITQEYIPGTSENLH